MPGEDEVVDTFDGTLIFSFSRDWWWQTGDESEGARSVVESADRADLDDGRRAPWSTPSCGDARYILERAKRDGLIGSTSLCLFHHPDRTGRDVADLEVFVAPDFWEVRASGTVYGRDSVLRIVSERHADGGGQDGHTMPVDDVRCRELGPSTYLLTYRLREGQGEQDRVTRRATVWERADTQLGWRVVYHQGTVASDG